MREIIDYFMIVMSYPPLTGGVERHVYELHKALGRRGLTGKIIVLHSPPSSDRSGEDVVWLDCSGISGVIPKTTWLIRALRLLNIFLRYPEAKLHFHDFGTIYPILHLLKGLGLLHRTFLTFHGWEGTYPPEPSVIRKRQKCEKAVRGNIAIGDFIRKWYGTEPDYISYGGVDVEHFEKVEEECNNLPAKVAYLGRFEADTGVLELIKAVHKYNRISGKTVALNLFGHGSLKEHILKMQTDSAMSLSVSEPVSDTASVLREFPIIFASGYLTILEALCARRIVFTYYNNPLREDYLRLHPAAGSMFICGDVEDVVKGLKCCVDNIQDICQMAQPGWIWARDQTWDKLAQQYIDLWGIKGR